jgi:hypothetical protein
MGFLQASFFLIRAFLVSRLSLAAENLALRQQVAVFKHSGKRPRLRPRDRLFWVILSRLWSNWRSALAIVQPETVIQWHRQAFKLYWRWKVRLMYPGRPTNMGKPGRPCWQCRETVAVWSATVARGYVDEACDSSARQLPRQCRTRARLCSLGSPANQSVRKTTKDLL